MHVAHLKLFFIVCIPIHNDFNIVDDLVLTIIPMIQQDIQARHKSQYEQRIRDEAHTELVEGDGYLAEDLQKVCRFHATLDYFVPFVV